MPRILHVCIVALCLWAEAPAPSSAAAPPSPSAILDKVAAAYGGRSVLDAIKNQVVVIQITVQGQPAIITTTAEQPNKFLQHVQVPSYYVDVLTGYDGTVGWTRDNYGSHAASGEKLTSIECQAIEANDSVLRPESWPMTVELKPNETVDGKSYLVLSVTPKSCPGSTMYVDPKTYLIARVVSPTQTLSLADWAVGPLGEKYAKSLTVTNIAGTIKGSVLSVKDNVDLDPSTFAMPPSPPSPSPSPSPAMPCCAMPAASPSPSATPTPAPSPTP